jgi:hypothetical protein
MTFMDSALFMQDHVCVHVQLARVPVHQRQHPLLRNVVSAVFHYLFSIEIAQLGPTIRASGINSSTLRQLAPVHFSGRRRTVSPDC